MAKNMPGSLASGTAELYGCVTDAPGRLEPWTAIPAGTGRPREPGDRLPETGHPMASRLNGRVHFQETPRASAKLGTLVW